MCRDLVMFQLCYRYQLEVFIEYLPRTHLLRSIITYTEVSIGTCDIAYPNPGFSRIQVVGVTYCCNKMVDDTDSKKELEMPRTEPLAVHIY